MTQPEFSRIIDIRQCDGRSHKLEANEAERAALSKRFDLVRINRLEAEVTLVAEGQTIEANGTIEADLVQRCAVSAEDLPAKINEDFKLRFVPATRTFAPDEEIELTAEDCDEIEYTGTTFDLGEAVSQGLALAIDPFATGPGAEAARELLKTAEASPFAILAKLKTGDDKKKSD